MISFCSQVCNRYSQITITLPHNLSVLDGTNHQLLVVVYPSTDGTHEFISTFNHPNLTVVYCDNSYDIIAAKNKAHLMADGDYLFNLDIDNFITPTLINFILRNYTKVIHNWSGSYQDGTYGRIGMPTHIFKAIEGYPSYMIGAGAHDDVILRNAKSLCPVVDWPTKEKPPLLNTKSDTIINLRGVKPWVKMRSDNVAMYNARPIFVPTFDFVLLKNRYGRSGGHIQTVNRNNARTRCNKLEYNVNFDKDFDFGLGGKLFGFGANPTPTGGAPLTRGWSVRPMWRIDGRVEFYVYHPTQKTRFGDSIVTPLKFIPGHTHTVSLNWKNDVVTMTVDTYSTTMTLVGMPTTILYHVFRGGNSDEWTSPTDGVVSISPVSTDTMQL